AAAVIFRHDSPPVRWLRSPVHELVEPAHFSALGAVLVQKLEVAFIELVEKLVPRNFLQLVVPGITREVILRIPGSSPEPVPFTRVGRASRSSTHLRIVS